ncbi:protein mono-ADP-ribosyltransferase TIPARP isoform X2 [Hemibagrus wyckioides]|nr:protein mono-ADP-ribosyltransferase TIPARP isoform X2 [Hemibagrus wyckioides]XP_058243852.1 protein mono-ADP-ribosyltransferase TIPARP isoform X2 [Hemibagrus wyckioides]
MEKSLGMMPEADESGAKVLGSLAMGDGEFADRRLGLVDKIPLVKPYFKKKHAQRKLDHKCLRALEDPILSTILGSDDLVAGDGIFVPRNPPPASAQQSLMCAAAVAEEARADATAEEQLAAGEQKTTGATRDSSDASSRDPGTTTAAAVVAAQRSGLEAAEKAANGAESSAVACVGNGELFRDKSDEASLDLVFELLMQLQYHTRQDDAVHICVDFLRGACLCGSECPRHHTALPYHWQIRRADTRVWQSVAEDAQEQLERLYCNPDNEKVQLKFLTRVFMLDFSAMRVCDMEFDLVRRLSTPSSFGAMPTSTNPASNTNPVPDFLTMWKYYCRDNFGWREYSEPVVRLIEEATERGLKEVRFITLQNQYILNIREGFQQNAVFGFRRQIKKRPHFMSSIRLSPHLQTLGGLSALEVVGPQPLSPTAISGPRLFPETWVPMNPEQDFVQVPVSREDRSYRTVYNLFHKTVSETKFRILKILRVQNPFLWEKYKRKKEYMSRRMSDVERLLNERHLFHGTSQDVVEGICKHNFDPRVCGKHATMFGQGSYFARRAAYSHSFARRSPCGLHYMFLAKVLTGKFTVGNPGMRRPPPLCPRQPAGDLFDSCVDNCVDPQIFVIFNDDQSYPYFIIQYEEVSSSVAI